MYSLEHGVLDNSVIIQGSMPRGR